MLYWTDGGTNPGIYRSSLDSPARETVVTSNIITPDAFTIDFTGIDIETTGVQKMYSFERIIRMYMYTAYTVSQKRAHIFFALRL